MLIYLKNEIKEMSEEEKKIEKPGEILDIVKKFLYFNKRNKERTRLKILMPDQMLVDYQFL